jgi:hypothetical protein
MCLFQQLQISKIPKDLPSNYLAKGNFNLQQTKVIKQLKVKIENDTARICPKNLAQGIIFQ